MIIVAEDFTHAVPRERGLTDLLKDASRSKSSPPVVVPAGLDALTAAIGSHIAATNGAKFTIECNHNGVCSLVIDRGKDAGMNGYQESWDYIDVEMFVARNPLGGSASGSVKSWEQFVLEVIDPDDTSLTTKVVNMTASPALFGPEVPFRRKDSPDTSSEQTAESFVDGMRDEDGWIHDQSDDGSSSKNDGNSSEAEGENETRQILKEESSSLVVSINMVEDFFYGCEDPDDLDPSLQDMVLNDPYYASDENGFGMLVYRGQCSFVQKAKLAEWLGCSLLIVIDSDTEGYVQDPPEKTSAELEQEDSRVQTFFQQLREGSLPVELGKFVIFFSILLAPLYFFF